METSPAQGLTFSGAALEIQVFAPDLPSHEFQRFNALLKSMAVFISSQTTTTGFNFTAAHKTVLL